MYQRPLFAAFLLSTENCMTSSPLAGYVDLANTTVAGFTGIHCKPGGSAAMMALVLEHCPDTRSPAPQDACARPHVPKRKRALKGASVKRRAKFKALAVGRLERQRNSKKTRC